MHQLHDHCCYHAYLYFNFILFLVIEFIHNFIWHFIVVGVDLVAVVLQKHF